MSTDEYAILCGIIYNDNNIYIYILLNSVTNTLFTITKH